MLEIKNLKAGVEDKMILNGIDLSVNAGEVHAIICLLYTSDAADE